MDSYFAKHGLAEYSEFLEDLGVESVEDLKFLEVDDLMDEGMDQDTALKLAKKIKKIVQDEHIDDDDYTEDEAQTDEAEETDEEETGDEDGTEYW